MSRVVAEQDAEHPFRTLYGFGKIGKLGERRFSVVLNTYQRYAVAFVSPYPFVALSDILNWQLLLFCYASGNKFRNHGCRERNTRHRGRGAARGFL